MHWDRLPLWGFRIALLLQAIVLALGLIAVSFAVLVALRDRWLGNAEPLTGAAHP